MARQGYVNLMPGGTRPGTADTAEMVAARAGFLDAGHYAPLADALAAAARASQPPAGAVLDAGAGTGYYLAAVLTALRAGAPFKGQLNRRMAWHRASRLNDTMRSIAGPTSPPFGRSL